MLKYQNDTWTITQKLFYRTRQNSNNIIQRKLETKDNAGTLTSTFIL